MSWSQKVAMGRSEKEEKTRQDAEHALLELKEELEAQEAKIVAGRSRLSEKTRGLEKRSMDAAKETFKLHLRQERITHSNELLVSICGEAIALSEFVSANRDWSEIGDVVVSSEWTPNYY